MKPPTRGVITEISPDTSNQLGLIGTHYSPDYRETVERQNKTVGLDLTYKWDLDAVQQRPVPQRPVSVPAARCPGDLVVHRLPSRLPPDYRHRGEDQLREDGEDREARLPERLRICRRTESAADRAARKGAVRRYISPAGLWMSAPARTHMPRSPAVRISQSRFRWYSNLATLTVATTFQDPRTPSAPPLASDFLTIVARTRRSCLGA